MIKKLFLIALAILAPTLAHAFSPVRYVQISTNTLSRQSGTAVISGIDVSTITSSSTTLINLTASGTVSLGGVGNSVSISSNTILTNTTFYQNGVAFIQGYGALTGKWLQIVSSTTANQTTTTSTSYVNTTLGLTITPAFSTSKIALISMCTIGINETAGADNSVFATLARGGANLGNGQGFVSFDVSTAGTDTYNNVPMTIFYVDSPASTSAQTYFTQIKVNAGTGRFNNSTGSCYMYGIEVGQ